MIPEKQYAKFYRKTLVCDHIIYKLSKLWQLGTKFRVGCCEILDETTRIQPDIVSQIVFSDEATFHTSGHVNLHYTIFWGTEKPRTIPEHERGPQQMYGVPVPLLGCN